MAKKDNGKKNNFLSGYVAPSVEKKKVESKPKQSASSNAQNQQRTTNRTQTRASDPVTSRIQNDSQKVAQRRVRTEPNNPNKQKAQQQMRDQKSGIEGPKDAIQTRVGKLTEGAVNQQLGGLATTWGRDTNDANEFKKYLDQGVTDGKWSQEDADKNWNSYINSNKKAKKDLDWKDSKGHEMFQALEAKGQEKNAKGDKQIEEGKKGLGKGGQLAADAYTSALGMLGDMATGPAWALSMASRTYGNTINSTRELVDKGIITEREAEMNALGQAAKETGTEYVFKGAGLAKGLKGVGEATKGFEKALGGAIDKLTSKIDNKMLREIAHSAMKNAGGIAEEATEELLGGIIEPGVTNLAYANKVDERNQNAYRENLIMGSTDLQRQVDYLTAQGYDRNAIINGYVGQIANDEYKAEIAAMYMENGFSEKQANKIASGMQEYMLASLSGDEKAIKAAEDKMVDRLGKYTSMRQHFSASDTLDAMASAALMVGVTGGAGSIQSSVIGADFRKAFEQKVGKANATSALLNTAMDLDDADVAARAQAMKDNGGQLANQQWYDLGQAIEKQTDSDRRSEMSARIVSAGQVKKSRYFAAPDMAIDAEGNIARDENGNIQYSNEVANYRASLVRGSVAQAAEQNPELVKGMDEDEQREVAESIEKIALGFADVSSVNNLTLTHPEARALFEQVTGETLPSTNKATREFLFNKSIENYVDTSRAATIDSVDVRKGSLDVQYSNSFGGEGQSVFSELSSNVDMEMPENFVQFASVAGTVYDFGRQGASMEDVLAYAESQDMSREDAQKLYDAGVADAEDSGFTVTYDVSEASIDKIKNSDRQVFLELAKLFGVNIVISDNLQTKDKRQANGSYVEKTNTLYLNLNDAITKNIGYTITHELTHRIKLYNKDAYEVFAKSFKERAIEKNGQEWFDEAIKERIERYRGADELDEDGALEEIIADQMGEILHDREFIENFVSENTEEAQTILSAIRDIIRKITQLFAVHGGFRSDYNEALLSELGLLREAEMFFANSIQEARSQQTQEMIEQRSDDADTIAVKHSLSTGDGLKVQLRRNQAKLNEMDIVASRNVDSFKGLNDSQKAERILREFNKFGYRIDRQGYGVIEIRKHEVKQAFRYLKTDAELAAFSLVPSVLKRGVEIETHIKHSGREYDTVTFAAPVELNGVRGNLAVAVKETGKNHYKMHRILAPDGTELEFVDIKKEEVKNLGLPTNSRQGPNIASSTKKLSLDGDNVKRYSLELEDVLGDDFDLNWLFDNPEWETDTSQGAEIKTREDLLNVSTNDLKRYMRKGSPELEQIGRLLYSEQEIEELTEEAADWDEDYSWLDVADIEERFSDFKDYDEPIIRRKIDRPEPYMHKNDGMQASYTQNRIDSIISEHSYGGNRASGYVTSIHPRDFLKLTLPDKSDWGNSFERWSSNVGGEVSGSEIRTLDEEELRNNPQTPYLRVDAENGIVIGHEGRHRMRAMLEAGITSVPIVIKSSYSDGVTDKGEKSIIDSMDISSQSFNDERHPVNDNYTTTISNVIPANEENRQLIEETYGRDSDMKFSLDSEGRELTPGQQEFFKESKIRDENGNLRVMYHGSRNVFEQFDIDQPALNGRINGKGFYFTYREDDAESWANRDWILEEDREDMDEDYEVTMYKVYLNIVNPYILEDINFDPDTIADELIAQGYDGIIVPAYDEVIAFYPEQIKSTDNENPTEDKRMKYSIDDDTRQALDDDGIAITESGSAVKYSLTSWLDTDQQKLLDNLMAAGFDKKSAKKWLKDVSSVAAIIAQDKTRLDYEADQDQKALKDNAEYYYTLDLSTLCQKRRLYQGTYNAIMHKLVNYALAPEDTIEIRALMDELGFEVPCGICYEESRKKNEGIFAKRWLNGHGKRWAGYKNMEHDDPYIPTLDEVTTTDGRAKLKEEHPEALESYLKYQRTRGSANPKVSFTHTDYRGDILNLTENDIAKVKHIGGLRIQSFSDLEMVHIIDMMQAVVDMASRNLTAQAYTKVPAFADIFGGTGIKINLSLIGRYNEETGQLEFDGKEGIDPDEAFRLRKKYSKHVGTILVGSDDVSILKAWADDRIDMVIPFHRSGWKVKEFSKLGLNNYKDYTRWQSERYDNGTPKGQALSRASKDLGVKLESIYAEDYWDYTKTGKENAEAYLKLCAEKKYIPVFSNFLVKNEDGSYSLQPDGSTDGYWKSLVDFKMYDNEGKGSPQEEVKPEFDMEVAQGYLAEHEGNADTLPVAQEVVDEFLERYKERHPGAKFSLDADVEQIKQKKRKSKADVETLRDAGEKLSEDDFYKIYYVHVLDIASKGGNINDIISDIKENGFRGKGMNVIPASEYRGVTHTSESELKQRGYSDEEIQSFKDHKARIRSGYVWGDNAIHNNVSLPLRAYGYKAGQAAMLIPSNYVSGESIVNGFKPFDYEVVVPETQYQSPYELYSKAFDNAQTTTPDSVVELTPVVAEDAVVKYSISKRGDDDFTSFIEDCLEGDTSDEAQARRQKSRDEIEAALAHIVRKDTQLTYGKTLNRKSVKKPIKELVFGLMESSENTYADKMDAYYYAMDMADAIWHKFYNKEADLSDLLLITSRELVEDIKFVDDDMYNAYNDLRRYMRNHRISVPEFIKEDISWADYRKKNFGRMLLTSESGFELDKMWHEISPMLVPFVDATEYTADGSDNLRNVEDMSSMFLAISDALDNTKAYRDAYADAFAQDIELQFAKDLAAITIKQGEAWESFADKKKEYYETRAKEMQARHKVAMRELREQRDKKLAEAEQKRKDDLAKQKQKYEERDEKRKAAEREKKEKQKAKKQDHRARMKAFGHIEKNYNWLTKRLLDPKKEDGQHIPEGFINSLASVLSALDLQTERSKSLEEKTGKVSKPTEALRKMREELQELSKEDESGIFVYNGALFSIMDKLIKSLDGHPLRDVNTEDLEYIDDMLASIKHMIQNENKLFADSKKEAAASAGESIIEDMGNKIARYKRRYDRKGPFGGLDYLLNESMMTPMNFFKALGGQMHQLYKNLRYGQDDYIRKIDELRGFFDELFGPYRRKGVLGHANTGSDIYDWSTDKSVQTFKLSSGEEIQLSVAQMMSLYCHSKREQSMKHILGSGVVVSDVKMTKLMDKVSGKVDVSASGYRMTYDDVVKITDALTDEQKEIAQKIQELMNGKLQEWGNETSMQLYGIRLFKEKNYFPIAVNNEDVPSQIGKASGVTGSKISNFGFTKDPDPKAANRLIIADIFEVVSDHANKMALYSAYAAPLTDFNRVLNYKQKVVQRDEQGNTVSVVDGYSVKGRIKDAYGSNAISFINNFLNDVNGQAEVRIDGVKSLVDKSLARVKKASIGANLRVLVQQPTAIVRAAYYINPKYFANPSEMNLKKNIQEMHEHCPIAAWKAWGNYQNDFTRGLQDIITNNGSQSTASAMWETATMGVYGMADDMTWGMIWGAVKNEVKAKHPTVKYGSEEFWILCNERASLVFDETQVVDSVFHRSDTMRSKDGYVKVFSSFMAEPTRTYNMMRSSLVMSYRLGKDGKYKEAAGEMTKALAVFAANAAAVSAAAALVDALRGKGGDDDDEYWELWYMNFMNNFTDNLKLWNNIVYAKDVLGMLEPGIRKWFGGEDAYVYQPSNMVLNGWYKLATGLPDTKAFLTGEMSIAEFISGDFVAGLGYITGVPAKTIGAWLSRQMDKFGVFATDEISAPIAIDADESSETIFTKLGIGSAKDNYQKHIDKLAKKYGGKSDDNMLEMATDGYRKLVDSGDFSELSARREAIRRAGGDVDAFDEKIHSYVGTSYKKTIGDSSSQEDFNKQQDMKDWMLSNGWTEQQISDVVYRSDTARDFKAACRMLDHDAAVKALTPLLEAGLTEQDIYKLWNNRNRGNYDTSSTGTYVWGTDGTITSGFGNRGYVTAGASSYHQGIDIGAEMGTKVVAADGGVVTFAGNDGSGYGNYIIVTHDNGTQTYYGHLSGIGVKKGQRVSQSQPIGNVGSTGVSTGPHLHFAMKINGSFVDPSKYIKQ